MKKFSRFDALYALKVGDKRQLQAYKILQDTQILLILQKYTPLVVGTIPLGIYVESSDIDIVCCATDLLEFREFMQCHFSSYENFSEKLQNDVYVVSFFVDGTEIEIYAKDQASHLQNGYRHMQIEYRILKFLGEDFAKRILYLKQSGLKTEPAFGKLLRLDNPYDDLLRLESYTNDQLEAFLNEAFLC